MIFFLLEDSPESAGIANLGSKDLINQITFVLFVMSRVEIQNHLIFLKDQNGFPMRVAGAGEQNLRCICAAMFASGSDPDRLQEFMDEMIPRGSES